MAFAKTMVLPVENPPGGIACYQGTSSNKRFRALGLFLESRKKTFPHTLSRLSPLRLCLFIPGRSFGALLVCVGKEGEEMIR